MRNSSHHLVQLVYASLVAVSVAVGLAAPPDHWPQFRGPDATGVVDADGLPEAWSTTENVRWVATIPGRGWSSPIVWGDRVFVTAAINEGAFKEPSTGIFGNDEIERLMREGLSAEEASARVFDRDIESTDSNSPPVRRMLYCLDATTGKTLWEAIVHRGQAPGGRHRKNTYASETPATDGERVYVYFGNLGLYAYSLEGERLWTHAFEPYAIYLDFGTAASPAIDDERVYVLNDNDERPFLAALDKRTGRRLWTVDRTPDRSPPLSGWATPFVWRTEGRTEIVTVGQGYATSYDTAGNELWRLGGLFTQPTPSPLVADGLLYVGTGSQGGPDRPMFAVRAGARGDISLATGERSNDYVAWYQRTATPYTPSPIVYRGRLYSLFDNGILSVFDARTGSLVYRWRVGGGGHTFSASPWAYGGKVFFLSEDGETFVVSAGDEYRELRVNRLAEMSLATPAIADGSLFIRTMTRLYRIGTGD